MNKRYVVGLDAEERERLQQLVNAGKVAGYKIRHANMLLMADVNGPAMKCRKGQVERFDYEYERNGTANIFMFTEPLKGWRRVEVTERRTRLDWAQQVRQLIDLDYEKAQKITPGNPPAGRDNLNTHSPASLYETFEPQEARRLIEKLEIIHTPRHGSWLNVAEVELAVMERQSIGGRVPDAIVLSERIKSWEHDRNGAKVKVNWHFTTADARIKLRRLHPQIQT